MNFGHIVSLGLLLATSAAHGASEDVVEFASSKKDSTTKPIFLFIMTDDQDLKLDSLAYTPLTMKYMAKKGTTFTNHFVTTALCCPSRISLLTGPLAHNTNVTYIHPPWGGYPKFIDQGFNDNYLPVWLQQERYGTYYTGKLMNRHLLEYYDCPHAAGLNGSDLVLGPDTYDYLNATYQRNHDEPASYLGCHTTEVLREKSMGFLEDALAGERPFFLTVAPIAPHSNINGTYRNSAGPMWMDEPIPEEYHKHLFPDARSLELPTSTQKSWIYDLPYRNQSVLDYNDHYYRQRLLALQGVDELVDNLITRLEQSEKINNTYIIYTSDDGFHISQHRLPKVSFGRWHMLPSVVKSFGSLWKPLPRESRSLVARFKYNSKSSSRSVLFNNLPVGFSQQDHSAASLFLEPLPNLDISSRRTTRHALHQIYFVGALQPWANFEADVANTYNSQAWSPRALASSLTSNSLAGSVHEEQVFVSDERSIQGRLDGRAGTVLGAVFRAQNQDLKPGSFKGAQLPYQGYLKAPDFVLMTSACVAKVLGEAKVPWIAEHRLDNLVDEFENGDAEQTLRHALGQVARYMLDTRLKYGFLTTYEQTIFLRKRKRIQ
ncbi:Alkaline phosphatase-like alpha/beta/alpha [Penicillium cf. griseofulvum]|nr:Alkaline phosphatase-like alpha/beta/alpha [Penicillium cf. griseofulvum]